jgi:hypothetical protein
MCASQPVTHIAARLRLGAADVVECRGCRPECRAPLRLERPVNRVLHCRERFGIGVPRLLAGQVVANRQWLRVHRPRRRSPLGPGRGSSSEAASSRSSGHMYHPIDEVITP